MTDPTEQAAEQAPDESYETFETARIAELRGEEPQSSEAAEETPPAESAEDSETPGDDSEQEEETPEGQPKRKGGYQRRIDKLTRRNAELAARLEALEQPSGKTSETQQPAANTAEGKPQTKDFSTWEEYTEALTAWTIDQRENGRKAEEAKAVRAQQAKAVQQAWGEQVAKGEEAYEDFDDIVVQSKLPVSSTVQQAILESDHGAHLAYWLGTHADELGRINKLSPLAAMRELLKIETQFHTAATPKPANKVTKAPPPARPVGGSAKPVKSIDDPDLPYEEYEKLRNKQLARR